MLVALINGKRALLTWEADGADIAQLVERPEKGSAVGSSPTICSKIFLL